jgi:hypothetical protein
MTEQERWEAACRADAEISPAEFERMVDAAEPHLIELERRREEAEQDALYVTYRQAAQRTGFSVGTIRERVKRDGVEVIGSGGAHRVRWGALREALQVRPRGHRETVGERRVVSRRRKPANSGVFTRLSREPLKQPGGSVR